MNGYHGTYYSIATCEDNGSFISIFGDHTFDGITVKNYTNVYEIAGIPFSDSDRFIAVKEVELDSSKFSSFVQRYSSYKEAYNEWQKLHNELVNGDLFTFIYGDKKKKISSRKGEYEVWMEEHPTPLFNESYYGFLGSIVDEN